jgi:hypothetical protein
MHQRGRKYKKANANLFFFETGETAPTPPQHEMGVITTKKQSKYPSAVTTIMNIIKTAAKFQRSQDRANYQASNKKGL